MRVIETIFASRLRSLIILLLAQFPLALPAGTSSGFSGHYNQAKETISRMASEIRDGDRESIEKALNNLRAARMRLLDEKQIEKDAQKQFLDAQKSTSNEHKNAQVIILKAQKICEKNLARISAVISFVDIEINKLEIKLSNTKPHEIDSSDFRLQPAGQ